MPAHNSIKLPAPPLVTSLILIGLIALTIFSVFSHPEMAWSSPNGQQLSHDVAITSVQAAVSSVNRGEAVKFDITAANLGTSQESFEIRLHDETDGKEADSVGVTVEAGQILALTLQWDTSGASPGVHDLRAVAELAGDANPANDTLALALPITVILAEILLGDGSGEELPAASFGASLIPPDTATAGIPRQR